MIADGGFSLRFLFVDYPHLTFGVSILVYSVGCAVRTKKDPMKDAALLVMYVATIYGAVSMGVDAWSRTNAQLGAAGWSQVIAFFMLLAYAGPLTVEIVLRMWRGEEHRPVPIPPPAPPPQE